MKKIGAALIAGGKSTRFGEENEDKAFAQWQGQPLWVVQLGKLLRLNGIELPVLLSTNPDQVFPEHIDSVSRVNDLVEGIGPLGALKTVFESSSSSRILVLAVDMPLMDRTTIQFLVDRGDSIIPKINDRWEPFAGIYPRKEMLELIDQQIAKQAYSLQELLQLAEKSRLIKAMAVAEEDQYLYSNINTKGDLDQTVHCTADDCTVYSAPVRRYRKSKGFGESEPDHIAAEEPLEVRVNGQSVSVMMRTPGHDEELVAGFLFTESVIDSFAEILDIEHCPDVDPEGEGNVVNVRLKSDADLSDLTRHVFTSSSCGVCGKATIDSVVQDFTAIKNKPEIDPEVILTLPHKLRKQQETFEKTGGLHASALFSLSGELLHLREDVGRHNALDKVIGRMLCREIDASQTMLLVSGRISFELMQKALAVKIPVVAGISAPSSLAVNLARESGQILIGFLRDKGFNLYAE